MKIKLLIIAFCCMIFVACGQTDEDKAQEAAQRDYDAEAAKNRAIWDANPGGELAALQCGKLADESVQYQKQYSRTEVYQTCMRDKGFGNLFK